MNSPTKVFRVHRALAWFYAISGILLSGVVVIGAGGASTADIIVVPIIFSAIFFAHYYTAQACREEKPGGRVASIVIACLMLFAFPIGTLIAIYLLVNTWRPWRVLPAVNDVAPD